MSVIICSRNRPALLIETIQSVLSGHQAPAELVVVDQSDSPNLLLDTLSFPRGCELQYVHSSPLGASQARNHGARRASHDQLLFLDDDLTVDPGWLSAFVSELALAGPDAVLTGQVREAEAGAAGFAPSCTTDATAASYAGRIRRDVLSSGNMAVYRQAFAAVGGFDESLGPGKRFPAAEDNDLGFRFLESGYTIKYVPQALAWHRAWRSEGEIVRLQWHYGRGQGAFYAKHMRTARSLMLRRLIADATRPLRVLPERIQSRRLRRMAGDLVYSAGILSGAAQWRASRL